MTTTLLYIILGTLLLTHIVVTTILFAYANIFNEGMPAIFAYIIAIALPPLVQIILTISVIQLQKTKEQEKAFSNQLLKELEKINEKLK